MRKLDLDKLKFGQTGITPGIATYLVEAAVFCLMMNGHHSGTILKVEGDFTEEFKLIWTDKITDQMRKSWNDRREVTEYGATAIAALLIQKLTNFEILARSEQGSGVDYEIGKEKSLHLEAFLEVSGIWNKSVNNSVNIRINKKLKQVENKVGGIDVFVIVTEFGTPISKIKKNG